MHQLKACIERARTKFEQPSLLQLRSTIASETWPVSFYQGENFLILPESDNEFALTLPICAYDLVDGQSEYKRNASYILDVVSAATNTAFWQNGEAVISNREEIDRGEVFVEDPDWIDDQNAAKRQLLLSEDEKNFVDAILDGNAWTEEQT